MDLVSKIKKSHKCRHQTSNVCKSLYHSNFFQIKDEFGLKEYLGSNLKKLSYLDLSVSNITGILFEGIEMPSLKTLYLDFCNKLCNQNLRCLDNFQKLKSLSIFGCDVEIESGKTICLKEYKINLSLIVIGICNINHIFFNYFSCEDSKCCQKHRRRV